MSNVPRTPAEYRAWWRETYPDTPYGTCVCGCEQKTNIAKKNNPKLIQVRGEPFRFRLNHHSRLTTYHKPEDRGYETPCWIWQGHITKRGYGAKTHNGKTTVAHIFTYETIIGPVPDGLELDHRCRQLDCVNPTHLEPVTHAENVRRGASSKLSATDVKEIRALLATGELTQIELGTRYGVQSAAISKIKTGRKWHGVGLH